MLHHLVRAPRSPGALLERLHTLLVPATTSPFVRTASAEVDPDNRLVSLADGQRFGYDKLVIATGADMHAQEIPGLASTRRRSGRPTRCSRCGERQRVLFLVPPNNKCAAGDFPIKQAFLAFLQADATADHIAAEVSGRPFRAPFDSMSMCIMEMFDKAAFAQVPVELTGDPDRPVRVRPDAGDDYKVGVSPVWRLGKKMLGFSVPMRFAAGEPFHAGKAWQGMDVGIRAMSSMLAD